MSNTHRAFIETSVPPTMELIASGPLTFCEYALGKWLTTHPLGEFETAHVAALVITVEGE